MARSEGAPVRESPQLILPEVFPHSKGAILRPQNSEIKKKSKDKKAPGGAPPFPRFERKGGDFDFQSQPSLAGIEKGR